MPIVSERTVSLFPDAGLFMPSISTSNLPSETASHVREAYHEVKNEPKIGIIEERHNGEIPIYIDKNPPYAGITHMRKLENSGEIESYRMGISDSLPTFKKLPNGRNINYKKRVAKHESRHVKSEKLLNYMDDVTEHISTLIMESYAEFGGIKANPKEKDEIVLTTPYSDAIKFGLYAEKFYMSDIDGSRGYASFIRDIQKYKSARTALRNLGRNIKDAVNHGINVVNVIESSYKRDVRDALGKAA